MQNLYSHKVCITSLFRSLSHKQTAAQAGLPDGRYFTANLAEAGKKPVF